MPLHSNLNKPISSIFGSLFNYGYDKKVLRDEPLVVTKSSLNYCSSLEPFALTQKDTTKRTYEL